MGKGAGAGFVIQNLLAVAVYRLSTCPACCSVVAFLPCKKDWEEFYLPQVMLGSGVA